MGAPKPKDHVPDDECDERPADIAELLKVELKYRKVQEFKKPSQYPIDLEQLHKLAALMSTHEEIAAILGISRSTFARRMKDTPAVREAYESGHERYRTVLRRRMLSIGMSRRGDAGSMCIWLSKQALGMSDKAHLRVEGDTTPGMSAERKRQAMAELMGEDPSDPDSGMEDDGEED